MITWDEELETEISYLYRGMSDKEIREMALQEKNYIDRGRVTYELTRRALQNGQLLEAALTAIDRDHVWRPKSFPPFCWAAALRIFGSNEPAPTSALLRTISRWKPIDQQNLLEWCFRENRLEVFESLKQSYGYEPNFVVTPPQRHS